MNSRNGETFLWIAKLFLNYYKGKVTSINIVTF